MDKLIGKVISSTPGPEGYRTFQVEIRGHAPPGIVPGYSGVETFDVTLHAGVYGINATTRWITRGRGYLPNMKTLRAKAIQVAKREWSST